MSIELKQDSHKGAFVWMQDGEPLAEMAHSWAGSDKFIIDHTTVDDRLRGQGIGRQLLDATVAYARECGVKIMPLCPFAKSVFLKDSSLADVWYQ